MEHAKKGRHALSPRDNIFVVLSTCCVTLVDAVEAVLFIPPPSTFHRPPPLLIVKCSPVRSIIVSANVGPLFSPPPPSLCQQYSPFIILLFSQAHINQHTIVVMVAFTSPMVGECWCYQRIRMTAPFILLSFCHRIGCLKIRVPFCFCYLCSRDIYSCGCVCFAHNNGANHNY